MINIVLFKPQIPPNTGNIIRLCANTGFKLHIIKPIGFSIDDKSLKRAGLDHSKNISFTLHENYTNCFNLLGKENFFCITKFGKTRYDKAKFKQDSVLLFGSETKGLPEKIIKSFSNDKTIIIPMKTNSRSLNLSNAVSIVVYEAWRQFNFY